MSSTIRHRVELRAPLSGWVLPLAQVCDEVFSAGMVGEGVAIDPVEGLLCAPCDGEVVLPAAAQHAVTLRHASGCEVLMHVGIDSVALNGAGFERLVANGQTVRSGDPLLRFDLDRIARHAKSAATPVLLASGGRVLDVRADCIVKAGDPLYVVDVEVDATQASGSTQLRGRFRVPFDHGLHARPAAQIVAALRGTSAEVSLLARGRRANARSAVAMMGLGVHAGDEVEVVANGDDAAAALAVFERLLAPIVEAARAADHLVPNASHEMPTTLHGIAAVRGLAIGTAATLHHAEVDIDERGRGVSHESDALRTALAQMQTHLESLAADASGAAREVIDAHRVLLQDPELHAAALAEIGRGASAAFGWRRASRAMAAMLARLDDARMRERAADLHDLEAQLLRALRGEKPCVAQNITDGAILLADELLPSQLAALAQAHVGGIVMARGGPTSHVALLAAARGIPTLVAVGEAILQIQEGTQLLLDADAGRLEIAPDAARIDAHHRRVAQRAADEAADLTAALPSALTRDGIRIGVLANLGAAAEAAPARARGAEGCGLLRTEFLFLDRRDPPGEDEQARVYADVAAGLAPHPLTIRTLDVGGDKPLAYLPLPREENPALGIRGLRVGLREPALLRTQLRAILRAGVDAPLRIMLPMVNDVAELRAARAIFDECARELGIAQVPAFGVMIETPSSALLADQLAGEADFLSIGSNDLSQYALAIDRQHAELAATLDALHPAVLRLIAQAGEAGARSGKSVSVCGGLGADADALPLLIGLGIREVSVVPAAIPATKRRLRELDLHACRILAQRALACESAQHVRALVAASINEARDASVGLEPIASRFPASDDSRFPTPDSRLSS